MDRPLVCIVRDIHVCGWPPTLDENGVPKTPGEEDEVAYVPLETALTTEHDSDALLFMYSAPTIVRRLNEGAWGPLGGVPMVLLIFDVDCLKSLRVDGRSPDSWWAVERAKIEQLRVEEPGVIAWRTRGGYRLLGWLDEPITLYSRAGADQWAELYLAVGAHLKSRYGIEIDPACKNWNRFMRCPKAVRDGGEREPGEFIGDPAAVGEWRLETLDLSCMASEPARSTAPTATYVQTSTAVSTWVDKIDTVLVPALAEVKEGGGRHDMYRALSGALLNAGISSDLLEEVVRHASESAGIDSSKETDDRATAARTTIGRAHANLSYEGIGALRARWPNVARAIDDIFPKKGERLAHEWLTTPREKPDADAITSENWEEGLLRGDRSKVKACEYNTILALTFAPETLGTIRWNSFTKKVEISDGPLADTDYDVLHVGAAAWMQSAHGIDCGRDLCRAAISYVAYSNRYNPVADWFAGLVWDGVERLRDVPRVFAAYETELNRAIFRRWFISVVARALEPGCKCDTMLVLVGEQGALKSTAFEALASPEWFLDTPLDITNKDAYMALDGKLIVEWAELESQARAKRTTVKSFLSSRSDKYRRPYAPDSVQQPRSCVIVGSTNDPDCLNDPTGERRFWPVDVGDIDVEWLRANREQLFAEAVAAKLAGERWWFDRRMPEDRPLIEALGEVHADHSEEDPWESAISEWLAEPRKRFRAGEVIGKGKERPVLDVTTENIIENALPLNQQTDRRAAWRVGDIMRRLQYKKIRPRNVSGSRLRVWVKKNDSRYFVSVDPK